MEKILFYTFSSLAIFSALCVILLPNMARALLSLIVTMFSLTVLYLLLGAPFVAMVNLIVYAGAVLVLFLFVIMLQGIGAQDSPLSERFSKGYLVLAFLFGFGFIAVLFRTLLTVKKYPPLSDIAGTVEAIGRKLFFEYLLPFELISILLLVGVFAAVALAKKEETV